MALINFLKAKKAEMDKLMKVLLWIALFAILIYAVRYLVKVLFGTI